MKIAIPCANGKLCMHFGHCEQFAIMNVDEQTKKIVERENLIPPPHEPGLLPRWLGEKGAHMIIAGGMGSRAKELFAEQGMEVVVGAPSESPEEVIRAYLEGSLETGDNVCDH